jgi:transcriptional regulator with XRE-family HTH domain
MSIDHNQVAKRISQIMQHMKLNQKHLAEILQVTQPAVSKYLQGRIPPPPVLLRLSQLSGRSMEWLLTGETASAQANKISESQTTYGRPAILTRRIDRLPPSLRQTILGLVESILQELNLNG